MELSSNVPRQVVGKVGRPEGGAAKASRELYVGEREVQRAVKVATLTDEAKQAAQSRGLDNNQSVLIAAALNLPITIVV